jgi:hypothetical protein
MRKLRQHQRVQLRMRREPVSGCVLTNPEPKGVSVLKGLFSKPLEKHPVLTHTDLKRVSGLAVANPDMKFERETR